MRVVLLYHALVVPYSGSLRGFVNVNNRINKCCQLNQHVRVHAFFHDKKKPGKIQQPEFVGDKVDEFGDILGGYINQH
jgi:hypothetical protein